MKNTIYNIIANLKLTEGRYGVEIEAEGNHLPRELPIPWRVENDGSLQAGFEAHEYVMNKPASLEGVHDALKALKDAYKFNRSDVKDTQTSGVHVHVNVQDYTPKQLFTFITTYFILEELLLTYCGEDRQGNHFCLRAKDAEYIIDEFITSAKKHQLANLKGDNIRYCSLNPCSLFKYGSLEFRAMRGTGDLDAIETWVKILDQVRTASRNYANPAEVVKMMSIGGEVQFVNSVLGPYAYLFTQIPNYREMVKNGVRIIQPLSFCTDWDMYKDERVNPFRREV